MTWNTKSSVHLDNMQRFIEAEIRSRHSLSTNWPAANVWVFIAQMVEHYCTNAEDMDLNTVKVPKSAGGLFAIA